MTTGSDFGGSVSVFDKWGNYMGELTPNGSDGCLGLIVTIIVYVAFGILMLLVFITVEGISCLKKREWGKALVYLLIPIIVISILASSLYSNPRIQTWATSWEAKVVGSNFQIKGDYYSTNIHIYNGLKYNLLYEGSINGDFHSVTIKPGDTGWITQQAYHYPWLESQEKCLSISVVDSSLPMYSGGYRGSITKCIK